MSKSHFIKNSLTLYSTLFGSQSFMMVWRKRTCVYTEEAVSIHSARPWATEQGVSWLLSPFLKPPAPPSLLKFFAQALFSGKSLKISNNLGWLWLPSISLTQHSFWGSQGTCHTPPPSNFFRPLLSWGLNNDCVEDKVKKGQDLERNRLGLQAWHHQSVVMRNTVFSNKMET